METWPAGARWRRIAHLDGASSPRLASRWVGGPLAARRLVADGGPIDVAEGLHDLAGVRLDRQRVEAGHDEAL